MKGFFSRPSMKAAPLGIDTNNDLCNLCLRALTINDQLAGGTTRVDTSDGTTTLDLCGFVHHAWTSTGSVGIEKTRLFDPRTKDGRVAPGWVNETIPVIGPRPGMNQSRMVRATDNHERLVTLPGMLEISQSASASCRLCSRLRDIFRKQYAERVWWNESSSILRFTIQYEWSEYRTVLDGEDEATTPPSRQSLDCLAVVVTSPGQRPNERDVYRFDIAAWPGTSPLLRREHQLIRNPYSKDRAGSGSRS